MKILQTILNNTDLFVFTESPVKDIEYFIKKYNNGDSKTNLGYELPTISVFKFLGNDYNCIHLWYDNEYDIAEDAQNYFNNLICL